MAAPQGLEAEETQKLRGRSLQREARKCLSSAVQGVDLTASSWGPTVLQAQPREHAVLPVALATGFSLTRASAWSPLAATSLDLSGSRGPCLAPSEPVSSGLSLN